MGYYIDFDNISLGALKDIMTDADLLKSRLIIKENIDENFNKLEKLGIANAQQLKDSLKTKEKIAKLASVTGIDLEYLTILNREINSFSPKPNRIADFPGLTKGLADKLEKIGIKNTLHLYNHLKDEQKHENILKNAGISMEDYSLLSILTDLSRIRWVNHTFAWILYEVGYHSIEMVAKANFEKMAGEVNYLNRDHTYFNGKIGVHDFKLTVDAAKLLKEWG